LGDIRHDEPFQGNGLQILRNVTLRNFSGFHPSRYSALGVRCYHGSSGKGAWIAFHKMKTFLSLLSLLSLAGLLMATTGCEVEEHGYRGGYYGPREYDHGYYYEHHDHDGDHDGHWDRGHYYNY